MALLSADSFIRPDQSGFGTASNGEIWTHPTGTATPSIVSNEGQMTGATGSNIMQLGTQGAADIDATTRFALTAAGDQFGVVCRSGVNSTRLEILGASYRLRVAGVQLADGPSFPLDMGSFYQVRFRAVGSRHTVKLWHDGSAEPAEWLMLWDDVSWLSSGKYGLFTNCATASDIIWVDSFTISSAADVIGPGPLWHRPPYVLRAVTGSIFTPFAHSPAWVLRPFGASFIRATTPAVLPFYLPRAYAATLITAAGTLFTAYAGTGTLIGTLTEQTALTAECDGVGTLTGTLSLATALVAECDGIGTLSGTLSANTALATTLAGVGTLNGTLSAGNTVALSGECDGVGALSGTLSANTALSANMAGVGTLAGTMATSTALATSLTGVGTLSGVMSMRIALSLVCAGVGTLSGTLIGGIAPVVFLSGIWVTRDMAGTWQTRDLMGTWKLRDEQGAWDSRDDSATWDTRDDQAIWKTR